MGRSDYFSAGTDKKAAAVSDRPDGTMLLLLGGCVARG